MKILYAIQGTGNGHASRAMEIVPILQQKAEVDVLISGYQCELQFPFEIKYQCYGLSFIFGKKGGIDFIKTYKQMNLTRLIKEIKTLPIQQYDLIINDFEPVSAWAAKFRGIPILSLSHQCAVLHKNVPTYGRLKMERLLLRYYAPAVQKFGFHFKQYSKNIFTPIIRKKIRNKHISNKGHYTVYLPAYDDKKIIKLLSTFKHIKWQVFSKHTDKLILKKNVTVKPINETEFIKSITSCQGVLCGAGFETPAEALFLKKKLMVIPMKNQYEQQCNALALKEMGIPVLKKLSKKQLPKIKDWLQATNTITVNYTDTTEDILETILMPYYHNTLLPFTVI